MGLTQQFKAQSGFVDNKCKHRFSVPSKLVEIQHVDALKILGVTITNGLSVSSRIQAVISSCAQIMYALRVLCAHGWCSPKYL